VQPIAVIGGLLAAATDRILEITLNDEQGHRADEVQITLDDRDFAIPIPGSGTMLTVSLGYVETQIVNKGKYKIDGMTVSGPPYQVKIHAKSVDMHGKFKEKGYKSFVNRTLGDIVANVAAANGYPAIISPALQHHRIDFEAQSEESGLHFLTRLANRYDATFKIVDGRVIFAERGGLQSVTGQAMRPLIVTWGNIIDYRCEVMQRPRHGRGRGRGWNRNTGREIREQSGPGRGPATNQARYPSSTRNEARRRAGSRGRGSHRKRGEMSVTIVGDPAVTSESPVVVVGVRTGLNGVWRAKRVTHRLSGSGAYTTKIDCEKPNTDRRPASVGTNINIDGRPVPLSPAEMGGQPPLP